MLADIYKGNWSNEELSTILTEAENTNKVKLREKLYKKAEEISVNKEVAVLPLDTNSRIWLINPDLRAPLLAFYQQLEGWAFAK